MNLIKHVKKNDLVQVLSGKDKGKTGKVLRVINKSGRVVVEKINLVKRHKRPTGKEAGGIVEKEAPIPASKVLLYADSVGRGVRTSVKFTDGTGGKKGKKVRVNLKHNIQLDK
jgi:large subunit ribosomal protein L24